MPIHLVKVSDPNNARATINNDTVQALALSIQSLGLLNPITLRASGDAYELVAGLHRLMAVRSLGYTEIPATILDADTDLVAEARLAENAARANLSPIEEARQLDELIDRKRHDVDSLARLTGRSVEWILGRLELLKFDPRLQEAIEAKTIPMAAARLLNRIPDAGLRREYIYNAVTHGINTRTAAQWLQQATSPSAATPEASSFLESEAATKYETKTTATCFICKEPTDLENTIPARICTTCNAEILHAAVAQNESPVPPSSA